MGVLLDVEKIVCVVIESFGLKVYIELVMFLLVLGFYCVIVFG